MPWNPLLCAGLYTDNVAAAADAATATAAERQGNKAPDPA